MSVEKVSYGGWPNCYKITNGEVELILTSDIGPRIIRYGFVGSQNLFKEFADQMGKSGEDSWQIRGGHRLWIGPEDAKYTYGLDNAPVQVEVTEYGVRATQPVEKETGLQKIMEIHLAPTGSKVGVVHRVINRNLLPVEFAPWAPTVMAQGGIGITGYPPRGTHPEMLAPTNPLVMWGYTDFSDPRWIFTSKYLGLRQDSNATAPQKVGLFNPHTFGAYLLRNELFLKQYRAEPDKTYPEFFCSFQAFTNADFLELETFGPMTKLQPGQGVELIENWSLHRDVHIEHWRDEEIDAVLLPLLQ
ncbi:hypothetical protein [Bryobacter aggregatus]|uniref:hypothetical protein n=1 Tax=Bryobacter aggregatus TaxID=360054 RepID=UPI0004E104E5|nr:hypothetical protein [Bryobacter aggregatus]